MQINDLINGLFELGGAIVIWVNIKKLVNDKIVKGVFWPIWLFYSLWGFWNLYYYPSLDQIFSFLAGILLVIGNTIWVLLVMYYMKIKKGKEFKK